jgi:hypothetical protein
MNRKIMGLVACVILMTFAVTALAQDEETPIGVWQKKVNVSLNLLQSSYSDNWNGGGNGNVVWTGNFDAWYEKQFNEKHNWRNTLKLAYGQTHNQERNEDGSLYWKRPDKTDDLIDFESMFRWTPESGWDPYVALGLQSMFEDQNDIYGRTINFNPLTLRGSAGISKKFVNQEKRTLLARLGAVAIRNSRSFFPEPTPSDETRRETSNEFGAELRVEYKVGALDERVDWESNLIMTQPFYYSGKSVFEDYDPTAAGLPADVADYTTVLDVDWENTFTANITKVISVKLYIRWVYDKYDNTVVPVVEDGDFINQESVEQAIRKSGQFKQSLALGFGYTWN